MTTSDTAAPPSTGMELILQALAEAERGPTPAELSAAPVLQLWQPLIDLNTYVILGGAASGHPTLGRDYITTSPVLWMAEDLTWCRTLSRFYRLQDPLEKTLAQPDGTESGRSLTIADAYGLPAISIAQAFEDLKILQEMIRAESRP